ncbi:MAG: serine/threonine protein kinase, partial [Acidobacteriota bacterium]
MEDSWKSRWQIERRLGRGGQGHTFLVNSIESGKQAVLKTLRNERSRKARRRMVREVASLKTLKPAGGKVPEVLDDNMEDFAHVDVQLFLVMEFIPGPTLRKAI